MSAPAPAPAASSKLLAKTRIRQAEPKDIDAVTNVFLACIASDVMFRNRYRYRDKYPDDHLTYSRLFLELVISAAYPDFLPLVLEIEEDLTWNIAALSIWDMTYENRRIYAARGETYVAPTPTAAMEAAGAATRKDKDLVYEEVFTQRATEARESFVGMFDGEDMYLSMLATHPAYRRRGYATQLVRWGVERSERDGVPISLLASSMGELVYRACGFEVVGRVDVRVSGDYDEEVLVKMVFRPRSDG